SVDCADVTNDGVPDVVVGGVCAMISVLPGQGDGTFGPRIDYSDSLQAESIAVGDVTGDGRPDIVAATGYPYSALVCRQALAAGGFGPVQTAATNPEALSVTLADVDGDGRQDAIVTTGTDFGSNKSSVSIYWNRPMSVFACTSCWPLGEAPLSIAVADFD